MTEFLTTNGIQVAYDARGSGDQTLILLDRTTVYNPSHFFGFFSTFNPDAINYGVKGVLRVMHDLGMLRSRQGRIRRQPMRAAKSSWVRARRSGILHLRIKLGHWVSQGQACCTISDALGADTAEVACPYEGLVIGHTNNPLVNQGDAILHIAREVQTAGRWSERR